MCRSAPQGQRIRSRPRPRCVGAVVLGILDLTKCNASFFFKEMNEQSSRTGGGRRSGAVRPRAWMIAGTARGYVSGARCTCKPRKRMILCRSLRMPACAVSPFINNIRAPKSAGMCVCPRPNSALLSSLAVRTPCLLRTQPRIHKTTQDSAGLSPFDAPVDSAWEIRIHHRTQTSCSFCCCSVNQIKFPCYLIHFALIKAKFRIEGNSSALWER